MAAQVAAGTLAPNTRNLVTRSWANSVGPTWGSMPVDQLRPVHLREWLLTLPAATADTALLTLRKIYSTVSGFVVLPIDPFAATVKYTMPTRRTRERSKRLYTFAEAKGHSGPPARNLARGAVHHGVLWIMSLRRAAGHLHRRGSAVRGGIHNTRNGRPRAPDGASGHRAHCGRRTQDAEVHTHSRGAAGCPGRLLEIADERRAAGSEWLADRWDGLPVNRRMCNHRWRKCCAAEGIEHIPWSNLRNSWRTICEMELHAPWDLTEMLMGHSLPGVSGRHYIRPSREQVARSVCDALGINWDIFQQTSR